MDRETAKRLLAKGVDASIILDELLGEEDAMPVVSLPAAETAAEVIPAEKPEPKTEQMRPDPILAAIEKLTGTIQAMNSRTRSFDPPHQETTEDILAAALGGKRNE